MMREIRFLLNIYNDAIKLLFLLSVLAPGALALPFEVSEY